MKQFQSTRPSRDGTEYVLQRCGPCVISIHPPLAGRDCTQNDRRHEVLISIHPPLAGRDTLHRSAARLTVRYFNPPAPRGTGRHIHRQHGAGYEISIHPPLAGRDGRLRDDTVRPRISIHPPLAGRDQTEAAVKAFQKAFQSTRPSRDGTPTTSYRTIYRIRFQSTRPSRDGTASA